jgi:protoporphyrinogen oxidase
VKRIGLFQPKAYPVYDEDYRDNIAAIRFDMTAAYESPS